jgi:hypothetical protein
MSQVWRGKTQKDYSTKDFEKDTLNKNKLRSSIPEPQVLLDGMQLNSKSVIKLKISSLREELALVRLT